jgi:sec-independent protein translocase protein TatA
MFRNPTTDLIVVLVIVLLIFGPKRLPGLGKQLGQGLREFKDSITGDSDESSTSERAEITRSSTTPLPESPEVASTPAAQPTPTAAAQPTPAGPPTGDSAERSS